MNDGCGSAAFGLFVGFVFGALAAFVATDNSWEYSATKAGVARWVVDERTGETSFEWIQPEGMEDSEP